jgi:hypothetical protein
MTSREFSRRVREVGVDEAIAERRRRARLDAKVRRALSKERRALEASEKARWSGRPGTWWG